MGELPRGTQLTCTLCSAQPGCIRYKGVTQGHLTQVHTVPCIAWVFCSIVCVNAEKHAHRQPGVGQLVSWAHRQPGVGRLVSWHA